MAKIAVKKYIEIGGGCTNFYRISANWSLQKTNVPNHLVSTASILASTWPWHSYPWESTRTKQNIMTLQKSRFKSQLAKNIIKCK